MTLPHIAVCICTFRRPELLRRLLRELDRQDTAGLFTFSIIVVDNDAQLSGRSVVEEFAARSRIAAHYYAEPRQNIALARNRTIENATGDYIAFLDDDEFPVPDWLQLLFANCSRPRIAGVLGPVRPHFDTTPPRWLVAGRFCERPEHPTGTVMPGGKCRTGNVLFRREILAGDPAPFRAEFGTGGEDVDFFQRMTQRGHVFVWCNEAIAYEVVPPSRWTRSFFLKRALLRGRNNLKLGHDRLRALMTSFVAVPAYSLLLPATLFLGQHVFMKYGIKFCDHLGRVLALFRLNPIKERSM
ncbi:MAG: glycosyltransferase [Verrucomicrobiota bacterium]